MTHRLFRRRENEKSCETCQEVPAGPPCYDCTFGLQTPPPRYTSVEDSDEPLQQNSNPPLQECPEFDLATLAHDASMIGVAVALAIDRSHADALQVSASDAVTRTRHLSDQTVRNSGHSGLSRNASAPHLQFLGVQMNEPLPPEEEPHLLLAALATISPSPEPSLSAAGESPLPCQLLVPE